MRLSTIGGVIVLGVCALTTVTLRASDFVGVYAVVEKIVLEPSDAAPQRVQIWGAFALSDQKVREQLWPRAARLPLLHVPGGTGSRLPQGMGGPQDRGGQGHRRRFRRAV